MGAWGLGCGALEGKIFDARVAQPEQLGPKHLPKPGTTLLLEHMPAFSTRAIGEDIVLHSTPISVDDFAGKIRKTLNHLNIHFKLNNEKAYFRKAHRFLYDWPVQRFFF